MNLKPLVAVLLLVLAVLVVGLAVSMLVASRSLPQNAGLGGGGWMVVAVCGVVAAAVTAVAVSILRTDSTDRSGLDDDEQSSW